MTISCIISFAPGTGGHFVGAVCQHLLYGNKIKISSNGSCHDNNLEFLGHPDLVIENSGEAISHEIVTVRKKLAVSYSKVILTHSRNIWVLSEKINKVIYINFSESDVDLIAKKYANKNPSLDLGKDNYNNIKDPTWPSYEDFKNGKAESYVYNEVANLTSKGMYNDWVWIVPALQKYHNIYKIEFSDIFGQSNQWITKLINFLDVLPDPNCLSYVEESWKLYKKLQ